MYGLRLASVVGMVFKMRNVSCFTAARAVLSCPIGTPLHALVLIIAHGHELHHSAYIRDMQEYSKDNHLSDGELMRSLRGCDRGRVGCCRWEMDRLAMRRPTCVVPSHRHPVEHIVCTRVSVASSIRPTHTGVHCCGAELLYKQCRARVEQSLQSDERSTGAQGHA